ncbi:sigma factor binding protein 1, chloroplastic-like [Quillaja saponaria]|uniref:Sigma factor binding protein 1, chloroplastic-like n=1 Tax=Quillaja saponaria TaxID=32244 RepID=A0AAD7VP42_QUISA|nr:sigma factor binding protein 1, chloroplastic-like [Quillaja saponaria]
MDVLGVNTNQMKCKRRQSKRVDAKKGIKVVYISSPMKVKTSASKFRALVQELTGQDSDTARFMDLEANNGAENGDYKAQTQQWRGGGIDDCVPVDVSLSNSDEFHAGIMFISLFVGLIQ